MKQIEIDGIIDINSRGSGYLLQDEEDIYIYKKNIGQALNGDLVKIETIPSKQPGKIEGKVTKILKRKNKEFVGILSITDNGKRKYGFIIPDSKKMHKDIFISEKDLKGCSHGEKFLCEITNWYSDAKNPNGKIVKSLGHPGENDTEMNSIIHEYGFEIDFPIEVIEEANMINFGISQEEIDKRRDMRDIISIGIDPIGAKDFDDSISYRKLKNGNEEISINIADVTHYVKKGSKIDDEAISRGTSLYLIDRVVPMLPEHLSNVVCSLNEGSDKLTYSYIFEFDGNYNIVNETFCRSVINMDRCLTYEESQHMIDTDDSSSVGQLVIKLNDIAKTLRSRRDTIEFSRTKHRFILDEDKVPIGIELVKSMDTNKLIEEFMLLTNRRVGEFIRRKKTPVLYRVHDTPNEEKLQELSEFVSRFGFEFDISNESKIKGSLNKLMEDTIDDPMESLISTLAVRTMSKAYCTTEEKSHYGLNFKSYIWYTSPIRRVVDCIATRVLSDALGNNGYPNK